MEEEDVQQCKDILNEAKQVKKSLSLESIDTALLIMILDSHWNKD